MDFAPQLFGAWRAAGLVADFHNDALTFCCPRCAHPTPLTVRERAVQCPGCDWTASGEPWAIATAGAQASVGKATATGLPLLDLDSIMAYEPDAREEIWPGGILSAGLPTAIVGAPGVGKSRLSIQAAICTILGRPFLGWETKGEGLKWLFLQTENSTRRLKMDLTAMTRGLTADEREKVRQGMRVLNIMAMDFASICMTEGHADQARILDTLEAFGPEVVVIDPLRDAGTGDPNKDQDMTDTCKGISWTVRKSNPRRCPLVVHHGRTGASEASKVFGDDAASFGRNSKVLNGWLRSQINVAPAGVDHPGIVIVGCGKCSDGRPWDPFAAHLEERTMTYHRLTPAQFNLDEWCEKMGAAKRKAKKMPGPKDVAEVVQRAGGEVHGGTNAADGLTRRVQSEFGVSRSEAEAAIGAAVEAQEIEQFEVLQPGRKPRIYVMPTHRTPRR